MKHIIHYVYRRSFAKIDNAFHDLRWKSAVSAFSLITTESLEWYSKTLKFIFSRYELLSQQRKTQISSLSLNGTAANWRHCNFRLNDIHSVAASTAEIMSQPVFCAFCVFRRLIPFTGGFMMWGIINQTINQYSTKHICGQSSVKRSSVAQAQNSLTVSTALWDGEILITGLIKGRSGWADWINLSRVI